MVHPKHRCWKQKGSERKCVTNLSIEDNHPLCSQEQKDWVRSHQTQPSCHPPPKPEGMLVFKRTPSTPVGWGLAMVERTEERSDPSPKLYVSWPKKVLCPKAVNWTAFAKSWPCYHPKKTECVCIKEVYLSGCVSCLANNEQWQTISNPDDSTDSIYKQRGKGLHWKVLSKVNLTNKSTYYRVTPTTSFQCYTFQLAPMKNWTWRGIPEQEPTVQGHIRDMPAV